jgi:putative salt-induced outer membrane protein YdiY
MSVKRWFVLLLPFLWDTLWGDQIVLKNGDRITGIIQKKDGANLVVKSDLIGWITIPWEAVTAITSEEMLTVVLPDGRSTQGKIAVKDQKLEILTATGKETVLQPQVGHIRNAEEQQAWERLQNPGFFSLWTGFADVGISLARGNAATNTVSVAVNASRSTRTDKTAAHFQQIFSSGKWTDGTSVTTAKAIRGGWAYNRNLGPRLFLNLFNDYEYDAFQSLDLRFVFGGGAGYRAVKKENTSLDFLGGADYSREKFSAPLIRNSAEAYWGNNLGYKISKNTTLTQSFRMFNNLTDTGIFRMNFDMGAATVLGKFLSWQLTFSDRYLSDPIPGRKKNDVLFTTGLRFTFSR